MNFVMWSVKEHLNFGESHDLSFDENFKNPRRGIVFDFAAQVKCGLLTENKGNTTQASYNSFGTSKQLVCISVLLSAQTVPYWWIFETKWIRSR